MVQCPVLTDEQRTAMREFHANARFSAGELNLQRNVQVFAVEDQPAMAREDQVAYTDAALEGDQLQPPSSAVAGKKILQPTYTTADAPLPENDREGV